MSDVSQREWCFYLDDMIDFAGKVLAYAEGLDQAGFQAPDGRMLEGKVLRLNKKPSASSPTTATSGTSRPACCASSN